VDFGSLINSAKEFIPGCIIVAVIAVIMLTYMSIFIGSLIEEIVETALKKNIKLFDHKKIWLSMFWSVLTSIALALSEFITWKEVPFYTLVILGASTFLYEVFLKKMGVKDDKETTGNS
jgi:glucan phosphoethanolaminetransferase (alkaline phosphatase superfamily)